MIPNYLAEAEQKYDQFLAVLGADDQPLPDRLRYTALRQQTDYAVEAARIAKERRAWNRFLRWLYFDDNLGTHLLIGATVGALAGLLWYIITTV